MHTAVSGARTANYPRTAASGSRTVRFACLIQNEGMALPLPSPAALFELTRYAVGQVVETAAAVATVPVRMMSLIGQAELLATRITVIADEAEALVGRVGAVVAEAERRPGRPGRSPPRPP